MDQLGPKTFEMLAWLVFFFPDYCDHIWPNVIDLQSLQTKHLGCVDGFGVGERDNGWVTIDLILAHDFSRSYFDNAEASHTHGHGQLSVNDNLEKVSLVVPRSGFDLVDITTSF